MNKGLWKFREMEQAMPRPRLPKRADKGYQAIEWNRKTQSGKPGLSGPPLLASGTPLKRSSLAMQSALSPAPGDARPLAGRVQVNHSAVAVLCPFSNNYVRERTEVIVTH